jgi:hypothetical protein
VDPRSEKDYRDYVTEDYKRMEDLDISGLTVEGDFRIVNTCIRGLTKQILQFKDVHVKNI